MVKQSSFVKNAAILSIAGVLVKVLGMVSRMILSRVIGAEGIGLYQASYEVYNLLFTISVTGIAVAVSKLVAEEIARKRYAEAHRVFKIATILLASIGFAFSILLIFGARFFATYWFTDSRAMYPLVAVAPAIFVVTLMASLRGRFQGMQTMVPTAISQVIEQIGKVATALLLAFILVNRGAPLEQSATAASFGTVVGSVLGLLVVIFFYVRDARTTRQRISRYMLISNRSTGQIVKRILTLSVPITLGAMVIPVMNFIDTAVVPRRLLVAGFSDAAQRTALYGSLTGQARPLMNAPSVLAYALAASLVPAISEASALGRRKMVEFRSSFAIKLMLILSIPAAVGLSTLSSPIVTMIYNDATAAVTLQILAFAAIGLTLQQTCTAILQGLGKTHIPVRNMVAGGLVKIILSYSLVAMPTVNIRGAAYASVVAYLVAATLNIWAVKKHTGMRIRFADMIMKPVFAAIIMRYAVANLYQVIIASAENAIFVFSPNTIATLLATIVGGVVYFAVLFLMRAFSEYELNLIPIVGHILVPIAEKLGMLRK